MNGLLYLAGAVAVISTLMVITRANIVHALLYLVVSLLSVSLVFFILGAPFITALEIIIYAGAIMVLFIFVIMMLNFGRGAEKQERLWLRQAGPAGFVGPACLSAILLGELIYIVSAHPETIAAGTISPKQVALSLLGTYVIGVELASILLLSGLVGAIYLGRPHIHDDIHDDVNEIGKEGDVQ